MFPCDSLDSFAPYLALPYSGFRDLLSDDIVSSIIIPSSLSLTSNSSQNPKNQKIGFIPYRPSSTCSSLSTTPENRPAKHDDRSLEDDISGQRSDEEDSDVGSDADKEMRQLKESGVRSSIKSEQGGRKGPYKKYSIEEKMRAVQMMRNGVDIKTLSAEFAIPRRNLLRWRKNGCQRKQGGGRPSDFAMEQRLFGMILTREVKTESQVKAFALSHSSFKKFKASKGWYVKFLRRFSEYKAKNGIVSSLKIESE